jgi:hypothetical protein
MVLIKDGEPYCRSVPGLHQKLVAIKKEVPAILAVPVTAWRV